MSIIYNLLIEPLVRIESIIYSIVFKLTNDHIISIVSLSFIVSTLVLPLYLRADELQNLEREKQKSMEHWVNHIKRAFNGDERFFRLSAYYREQNYKPIYALKSSLSLLLQIPFFTAAYIFFTSSNFFDGIKAFYIDSLSVSGSLYYLIEDLSKPDGILKSAYGSINLLPIFMTIINIISAMIYTKGFSLKERIQTLVLPMIFLLLLYNCPAGLVIYWTCNNLYSLIKNLIIKIVKFIKQKSSVAKKDTIIKPNIKSICLDDFDKFKSVIIVVLLTLFLGLCIPLETISVSINEFLDISYTPWYLISYSVQVFFGFSLWIFIFYKFFDIKTKKKFLNVVLSVLVCFAFTYFLFSKKFGSLTPDFTYIDSGVEYSVKEIIINTIVLSIIYIVSFYIFMHKKITYALCLAAILSLSLLCVKDFNIINQNIEYDESTIDDISDIKPEFEISKNNKNVILIMLDSASGPYIPYMLNLKPELKEKFLGFTWYRNTLTFGKHTLFGTPGIYGGYEYIPYESNKIQNKKLVTKMNEALSLIPTVLSNNNFDSFICDVPYADMKLATNKEFFDKIPNTKGVGYASQFLSIARSESIRTDGPYLQKKRDVKLLHYVFMRCMPFAFQELFYDNSLYLNINNEYEKLVYSNSFLSNFYELKYLSNLFTISNDDKNKYIVIDNNTCHTDNAILPYPSFYPTAIYDNVADGNIELVDEDGNTSKQVIDMGQFDPQVAAFIQLGNFMDYLRENNLYDNSRIIIVSDHSFREKPYDIKELVLTRKNYNGTRKYSRNLKKFMPVLFVKDFNSRGDFEILNEFMTNADTPSIIFDSIVDEPINPYTGKIIDSSYKDTNDKFYLTCSGFYNPPKKVLDRNEYLFTLEDAPWIVTRKNIYNVKELEYDWSGYDPNFK